MGYLLNFTVAAGLAFGMTNASMAQDFDPRKACGNALNVSSDGAKAIVSAWAFGYLSTDEAKVRPITANNLLTMADNLAKFCRNNPELSMLDLMIKASGGSAPAKPAAPAPGSEADARALLMKFYAPNADHEALTAALFPSKQEIQMVYQDPLASQMAAAYAAAFKPGIKFQPKPEHDDLLVIHTSTDALLRGDDVLGEFPGGYKKVLGYMNPGYPIVRFKFITKGETLGLAFDGLVYINDHWVIMPKPWRALN